MAKNQDTTRHPQQANTFDQVYREQCVFHYVLALMTHVLGVALSVVLGIPSTASHIMY